MMWGSAHLTMLDLICRFVAAHHPLADAALLAGSWARGEATANSDCDVVLLFSSLPNGAWREMANFDGQEIEVFAHDLHTLAYFCREVDRPSGVPALPAMVAEGISVLPRPSLLIDAARGIAVETLQRGPSPLDADAILSRRYAITDLAMALQPERGRGALIATAAALYAALADFALRAAGYWSASGKAFPRALGAMHPRLPEQFETAFTALFAANDAGAVRLLVRDVLVPYGGELRGGFRRKAPAAWRDAPAPSTPG